MSGSDTQSQKNNRAKSEKQTQNGILFKNDIFSYCFSIQVFLWERILKEKEPQKPKTLRKR